MENNIYKTKDLYEAAAIFALQVPLEGLEWQEKHSFFIFSKKEHSQKIANEYWNGQLTVNAMQYAIAIRKLKDRLFAYR